jgi:hypothetical protein
VKFNGAEVASLAFKGLDLWEACRHLFPFLSSHQNVEKRIKNREELYLHELKDFVSTPNAYEISTMKLNLFSLYMHLSYKPLFFHEGKNKY